MSFMLLLPPISLQVLLILSSSLSSLLLPSPCLSSLLLKLFLKLFLELLNRSPSPSNPPEPPAKNSKLRVYSKGKWHRKEMAQRALPEQLQESEPTPSPPEISQGNSHPDSSTHESPDNRPIALRKGVRSCTNHPIYTFLSYKELSPKYRGFISNLDKIQVPNNIYEAMEISQWKATSME